MPTLELMIVFGALMAIVAVVAIAIDWVGKPLRGRRFIPRVYRFDDELEPVELSRTVPAPPMVAAPMVAMPAPMAAVPPAGAQASVPAAFSASVAGAENRGVTDTDWTPNPTVVAIPPVSRDAEGSLPSEPSSAAEDWDELLNGHPDSAISGVDPGATHDWGTNATEWDPSMALDAILAGVRPTPIDKAERFWKATAISAASQAGRTHYDDPQIQRMLAGRAPTRLNPRTSRQESPELLGLRAASHVSQVHVFWPGESVDPWAAQ